MQMRSLVNGGFLMALITAGTMAGPGHAAEGEPFLSPPTDYGRSYVMTAGGSGNQPVFWLESRCRLTDPSGEVRDYYQCASCKSEATFADHDLFLDPNYDFLPVFNRLLTSGVTLSVICFVNDLLQFFRYFHRLQPRNICSACIAHRNFSYKRQYAAHE